MLWSIAEKPRDPTVLKPVHIFLLPEAVRKSLKILSRTALVLWLGLPADWKKIVIKVVMVYMFI